MRRPRVLLTILMMIFPLTLAAAENETWHMVDIVSGVESQTILVKGKNRDYFRLTPGQTAEMTVTGPQKMLVRTRLILSPEQRDEENYEVYYVVDQGPERRFKEKTRVSTQARFPEKSDQTPGSSMIFELKIPKGTHTYKFYVKTGEVLARFYTKPLAKKISWEPLLLSESNSQVFLTNKNDRYPYYVVEEDQQVQIEITGPARLKILSRLNYTPEMVGDQTYLLVIKHDGDSEKQLSYTTQKSKKYVFTNDDAVIPSIARTTLIDVPNGAQKYTIYLTGTQASSGAVRFLVNK